MAVARKSALVATLVALGMLIAASGGAAAEQATPAWVARYHPSAAEDNFLGGVVNDGPGNLAVDVNGNVYVAGGSGTYP